MTTTLAILSAALKTYFEGPLYKDVITDDELFGKMESNTDVQVTTGGRRIERAHLFGLNRGTGARRETGYIPVPRGPVIRNSFFNLKKYHVTVQMTADVMKRAKTDRGAFADWAEQAMPLAIKGFRNDLDIDALGYGFGIRGVIDTISVDRLTITLKDSHGVPGLDSAWINFLEGDSIIAADGIDGTTIREGGPPFTPRIVSQVLDDVDDENGGLLLESAAPASWAVGDYLFLGDASGISAPEGSTAVNMLGLLAHVDDGNLVSNYLGIDRDEFRAWRSLVFDASSKAEWDGVLNEDLMQDIYDISVRRRGCEFDQVIAPIGGQTGFWRDLREDRSLNDPTSYTAGKPKGLRMTFGDKTVDVMTARKMPNQLAFFLNMKTFIRHEVGKIEWDDTTGAVWKQVVDAVGRKDEFYAYARVWLEVSNTQPGQNVRVDNLGVPFEE